MKATTWSTYCGWASEIQLSPVNGKHPITHRIHVWYIYANIYHQYTTNVSIYTSTMDPMGSGFQPSQIGGAGFRNGPSTVWSTESTNLGARMRCNSPQAEIIRTELFHIPLVSDISIICQLCFNYSIIPVVIFFKSKSQKIIKCIVDIYIYIYIYIPCQWYMISSKFLSSYSIFHIPYPCHYM